ncbi:MAG TPA: heparin lyase I family protein [Vicinamibacteria bacterium]
MIARRYVAIGTGLLAGAVACGGSGGGAPTNPGPAPGTVNAVQAASLRSFEGEEEPAVIYHVAGGTFSDDGFDNMTEPSPGLFRFTLRYHPRDWWDGDRTTGNIDRQRAEVKGLGPHQRNGETFEYATTWRTSRLGTGKFWHVFQLKATDGDDAPPLVVNSIQSGQTASVRYWPGNASNFIVARSYTVSANEWTTVRIRVRTSTAADGVVLASVNGDAFAGVTGVPVYRPESTDYRPKWGSYRGVDADEPYGEDVVEHRDVSAGRVSGPP